MIMPSNEIIESLKKAWSEGNFVMRSGYIPNTCYREGCNETPKAARPFSFIRDGEYLRFPITLCQKCQDEIWAIYKKAKELREE